LLAARDRRVLRAAGARRRSLARAAARRRAGAHGEASGRGSAAHRAGPRRARGGLRQLCAAGGSSAGPAPRLISVPGSIEVVCEMVQNSDARPRGRPRAFDPQTALQRAREAFWDRGFAGTSLDDLSERTGMNRPSLYAAFGDKQELYLETLRGY